MILKTIPTMPIEDEEDPNLILDLPPLMDVDLIDVPDEMFEPPFKQQCIDDLTRLLIQAEQNEIYSLCIVYEYAPEKYGIMMTSSRNPNEMSGALLDMAVSRLGYAYRTAIVMPPSDGG